MRISEIFGRVDVLGTYVYTVLYQGFSLSITATMTAIHKYTSFHHSVGFRWSLRVWRSHALGGILQRMGGSSFWLGLYREATSTRKNVWTIAARAMVITVFLVSAIRVVALAEMIVPIIFLAFVFLLFRCPFFADDCGGIRGTVLIKC